MTTRCSTETTRRTRCRRCARTPKPSRLPVFALGLLAIVVFYAAMIVGLFYEPLYGAGLLFVWFALCLGAVRVYERGRAQMARKKGFFGKNTASSAKSAGSKADHRSPLRRIVGYEDIPVREGSSTLLTYEVLECGHKQLPKTDITGHETVAIRRRCKKCAAQEPGA
jgi:hypothetical protein